MKKTIGYVLTSAIILALLVFQACSKKDDALPQIDGFNNSNEVAKANLVAHWTFDDNNNEVISGTAPSNTYGTAGSTTGQIGKALQLTKGALVYPPIAAINTVDALNNFSVSLWVNVKDTKAAGGSFTAFFQIVPTSVSDIWGNVGALAETARHLATSDTLELKNYLNTTLADGTQSGQDNLAQLNTGDGTGHWFMGAKRWAHYVLTWDATSHKFQVYGDAVASGAYTVRGTTPVLKMRVPAQAVFGSLAAKDIGFASAPTRGDWYPMATASIDDVRVYNTVLAETDITALFNLGTAGR
jgi:hypothetical protein